MAIVHLPDCVNRGSECDCALVAGLVTMAWRVMAWRLLAELRDFGGTKTRVYLPADQTVIDVLERYKLIMKLPNPKNKTGVYYGPTEAGNTLLDQFLGPK